MKRLIIFLLLFAALKVAGQTIGHLRFDTVMIYKVGGTGELALMNATKDTLGVLTNYGNGRTRFIKSRAINDSTIVVGLDTLTVRGAAGFTASNGLTKTGNNITLGGNLSQSTTIDGLDSWILSLLGLQQFRVEVVAGHPDGGNIHLSASDTIFMGATSYKMNALSRSSLAPLKPMLYDTINHEIYYGDVEGTGGGSTDTTELGFPLYASVPVDENDPDTLKILRDSAYMVPHLIQDTLGDFASARSTAGSLVEYPDGKLALAYSFYFGADIGDQDSAKIANRISYDRGATWTDPIFLTPTSGYKSTYVPSMRLLGDTLYMIHPQVNPTATGADFWMHKSVDTGKTWDAGVNLNFLSGFPTHGSHRIYYSQKYDRYYFPFAINTPGSGTSTGSGNYEGRLAYSDDNMVNWTVHPTLEVAPDDSIATELEIHEADDSLYLTWRGRSGWMLYVASGDGGDTWVLPTAINPSTANFGIKKPNSMHSIQKLHNDRLWLAIINPVFAGEISNSGTARRKIDILASTSGKPGTFYPAQSVKFDTTGGKTYGDINICITTDYAYALYYSGNRASTGFQYELTRLPLNKFAYMGVTDSLPRLYVKHKGQYHDTVIARFTDDKVMPAGVYDIGGLDIVNMPRNGVQDFSKFLPGIVGRGFGSNTQTGLIIQGVTPTNSAVTPSSNWDAAINFDGRYAGGELTNFDLVRFTNNGNAPYLRMIPTASTDGAHVWFKETALFGSTTAGATTYQLQVRNDVTHTSLGVENRNNDASQNRIDFLKTRAASIASTNDFIGGFTFNVSNNYFRAIGSSLTNSVTGARLVNYQWGTVNQANSNIIGMSLSSEGQFQLPVISTRLLDTTTYKPTVVDASGNLYKTYWQAGGGSSYTFQHSLTESAGTVNLVGDAATPGANQVYGTDGSGVKGWKADPAGGSVSDFIFTDGSGFDGTVTTSTSTPTLSLTTSLTTGSVPFIGASGALSQDNANLFWDNSNKRLGIGTATPLYKADLRGTAGVNLHMVSDADDDGAYHAMGSGLYYIGMNSAYNGSTHTAKATTSAVYAMSGSTHFFYANSGLTAGNTYSLTERMRLNTTGLGIGTASPAALLHPETADGGTNAITFPLRISHVTSSTATTGFGVGLQAAAENGSGTTVVGGTLAWPFTDATAASEDIDFTVNLMAGGSAAAEKFRVTSTGVARFNNAFSFPTADGTNGQVLQTNGSGTVTWQTLSGGISGLTAGRVTLSTGATSIGDDANLLYSTADAGTFSIGTTNTQGHLNIGGNKNLGSSGAQSYFAPATYTDNVTAASGTSSSWAINVIGAPTIAATNSSVSVPSATTFQIEAPIAGTNVTFSTPPFSLQSSGATSLGMGVKRSFIGISNGTTNINYTHDIVQCNATGGNVTATLPNSTLYGGFTFTFIRSDASGNTVTINTTSSQTINGNASYSLAAQYNRVTVVSDGSNWLIIESN